MLDDLVRSHSYEFASFQKDVERPFEWSDLALSSPIFLSQGGLLITICDQSFKRGP